MIKRSHLLGILIVVLILAACTPAAQTPAQPNPTTPPVELTQPVPTQAPAPTLPGPTVPETGDQPKGTPGSGGLDANGPVVVYVRTGGIAGISERWEIFPDGRVVNQDGTEFQIDAEQVTKLVASFEQAGFFEMQPPRGPGGNCADCFTYEVAVRSGEKTHQVKFTDVDSNLPGAFMQTLQELNGMLDELKTP